MIIMSVMSKSHDHKIKKSQNYKNHKNNDHKITIMSKSHDHKIKKSQNYKNHKNNDHKITIMSKSHVCNVKMLKSESHAYRRRVAESFLIN